MSLHYLPETKKPEYYVYAMLCQDGDGPLYVKFGRSRKIGDRLSTLRTASPIPAKYFAVVQVPGAKLQGNLEKALHRHFADRRITGEWFKFDSASADDKRAFNDGCALQIAKYIGAGHYWEKLSVAALDEYAAERKAAFCRAMKNKKFAAKMRAQNASKAAWCELDRYGR